MINVNLHKDGHEVIIESSGVPILSKSGELIGYRGIDRDITESKKIERELLKAEEQYRSTVNNLLVGIVVHACNGEVLMSNPEAVNLLGLTKEQMQGKELIDPEWKFVFEDFAPVPVEKFPVSIVLSTQEALTNYVLGVERSDREFITWVIVNAIPIFTSDGTLEKVIVNFVDITERKQSEEVIREERDRTQKYLDTVEAMIVALDDKGTVSLINRKGCEIIGRSEEELTGAHWFETCLPQPQGMELVYPYYLGMIQGDVDQVEYFENEIVTATGELRTIAWHNNVLRDEQGVITGTLSAGEDITERKRTESALQKSEKALEQSQEQLLQSQKLDAIGKLAGGIAHDFNNMLGGIMGGAQLLQNRIPSDEKSKKFLSIIEDSAHRAADLTSKLLTFSRRQSTNLQPLDLHSSVHDTIGLLENTIDKRINIVTDLSAELSMVIGDTSQLQNVLLNLGINASHAITESGKILYSSKVVTLSESYCENSTFALAPGKYIKLNVDDNGDDVAE
jgi:PAS domain S-box-containing protein